MPNSEPHRLTPFEDLDEATQRWVHEQVPDWPKWSDEYATHVMRLFFPGEDFILVSDKGAS
jgi:hypothetical protein